MRLERQVGKQLRSSAVCRLLVMKLFSQSCLKYAKGRNCFGSQIRRRQLLFASAIYEQDDLLQYLTVKLVDHGLGVGEFPIKDQVSVARFPVVVNLQLAVAESVLADLSAKAEHKVLAHQSFVPAEAKKNQWNELKTNREIDGGIPGPGRPDGMRKDPLVRNGSGFGPPALSQIGEVNGLDVRCGAERVAEGQLRIVLIRFQRVRRFVAARQAKLTVAGCVPPDKQRILTQSVNAVAI